MWSAPVQVKLQVSLAHRTWSGELSRLDPDGYSMVINTPRSVSPDSPRAASFNAQFRRVKAAGYARPHTACMNGVQPSAFLSKTEEWFHWLDEMMVWSCIFCHVNSHQQFRKHYCKDCYCEKELHFHGNLQENLTTCALLFYSLCVGFSVGVLPC